MKRYIAVLLCAGSLVGLILTPASTAEPAKPSQLTTVKVGLAALWISAPIYVARGQGFFRRNGLNVEPVVLASTPAMVAAANSGSINFGVGALSTLFQARAQGLGLKIVSPNSSVNKNLEGVAVAADSSANRMRDLAGKSYCINILNGQAQGQAKWSMIADGGDPDSIRFIGIPFAEAVSSLVAGRVDACQVVQPYLSPALEQRQIKVIADDTSIFGPPGSMATAYFGTRSWVSRNTDTVRRFVRAMTQTHEFIAKNPRAVANVLPRFTGVTPDQAAQTAIGTFPTQIDVKLLQTVSNRFVRVGLVSRPINASTTLWKFAPKVRPKKR
jgi:NitT/TauT family transport system substrate-binding protein